MYVYCGSIVNSQPNNNMIDNKDYHKTKRVLGQRIINGTKQYLIQFSGEPAKMSFGYPSNRNERI